MMSQYPPSSFDPNQVEFAERPPAWPLVIGWVSIAWAALGTLCGICGAGSLAIAPSLMPTDQGPLPPAMQLSPGVMALTAMGTVMGIFLLTCGIMCLRRNAASRGLFLVYSVVALLFVGVSIYIQLQQGATMAKWVAENPDSPFAAGYKNPGAVQAQQIVGIVVGVLLGSAFPVFLLIWFGLVKTKPEQFGRAAEIVA
jgi:hypothetical protein